MARRAAAVLAGALVCVAGARAWALPSGAVSSVTQTRDQLASGESVVRALGCGGCHAGVPAPASPPGRPLAAGDPARDPAVLFAYLRDRSPARVIQSVARMPYFHLDDAEALALALYLATGASERGAARERFEAVRAAHRDVDAALGARIFRAMNCTACHRNEGVSAYVNGPPLAGAGERMRADWLRAYLARPVAVRPFGFHPGSGGRMPDFALGAGEVDSIAAYLGARSAARADDAPALPLSAFGAAKARALLEDKLSCLGCHALSGQGGRVGPDLASVNARLRLQQIRAMVADPAHAMPGTIMPRAPIPPATRDLIVHYLTTATVTEVPPPAGAPRDGYLSLIEHPTTTPVGEADPAARLYSVRCAACHGASGRGDGYNARYLRARPAAHASAEAMSRRPDDTLYDGIHAGGVILGGSPEMPAFGASLTTEEITGLVRYIRRLCNCQQPAWAADARGAAGEQ